MTDSLAATDGAPNTFCGAIKQRRSAIKPKLDCVRPYSRVRVLRDRPTAARQCVTVTSPYGDRISRPIKTELTSVRCDARPTGRGRENGERGCRPKRVHFKGIENVRFRFSCPLHAARKTRKFTRFHVPICLRVMLLYAF